MNLEQLRAWLDAHGGYQDSIPTTRSVTKKTPAGDTTADEQVTVMVAKDGSQLTVRSAGEDTYEVVGEPKLAAPTRASTAQTGPPGGKPYIDEGPEAGAAGRRYGWNPATGAYDRDLGPSPAAQAPTPGATTAEGRKPVPNHPGFYEVTAGTKDAQGNTVTTTHYEDAQGNTVELPGATGTSASSRKPVPGKPGIWEVSGTTKDPQGNTIQDVHYEDDNGNTVPTPGGVAKTSSAREPVPGKPGVYLVKAGSVDANGNTSTDTHYEDEQGNRIATPTEMPKTLVDLPNGTKGQLIADPDNPGQWKAVPVAGTEKPPESAVPTIDINKRLGEVTTSLKEQWDSRYVPLIQSGQLSQKDALEQFERDRAIAQAKVNEDIGVLNAQSGIRSQDVSQRGQSLTSVENQRSNVQNTLQAAMSSIKPQDFGEYYPGALKGIMSLYGAAQQEAGIPRGVPSEQPYTPQQASVMGAAGPSPIVFNINTGGAVPSSVPMAGLGTQMGLPGGVPGMPGAMPPPSNPEQLLDEMKQNSPDPFWDQATERVRQDLQAARAAGGVAPGMSLSGGQLRAPGASRAPVGAVGAGPVGQVGG